MNVGATLKAWLPELGTPVESRWSPAQAGALGLVVAVAVAVSWLGRLPALGSGGDESLYLLLSRSLASGHYRDTYLPGAPAHAHFPPGLPAWLLLIRTVAGPALDAVRAANLLVVVAAALLVADGLRRLGMAWLGIGAAALLLWNPSLQQISMTLHSEALFLFLSVLAAWAALRADLTPRPWWPLLACSAAIAAFATRTAGLGVIAGIGIWALTTRRWRMVAGYSVLAGATVLAWFSHLQAATPLTIAPTYVDDFSAGASGPAAELARLGRGIAYYLGTAIPNILQLPMIPNTPVDNLAWLVVLGTAAVAGLRLLARPWPALPGSLFGGGLVLLAWTYWVDRLLLAVLPWLAVSIMVGARATEHRLKPGLRSPATLGLWGLLAGSALVGSAQAIRAAERCNRPNQYAVAGCVEEGEARYMLAVEKLAGLLPANAVVAAVKPSILANASGLRAVSMGLVLRAPTFRPAPDGTIHPSGITHILLSRFTETEQVRAAGVLLPLCQQFRVVAEVEPGVLLLTLRGAADAVDACADLRSIPPRSLPPE